MTDDIRHTPIPENLKIPGKWVVVGATVCVVTLRRLLKPVASKPKVDALMDTAAAHIDRRSTLARDVMVSNCQMYDNAGHLPWFKEAVAKELTQVFKKYSRLAGLFEFDDTDHQPHQHGQRSNQLP